MLIYQPAGDAYHCVFRLLAITKRLSVVEADKARLLDFYLLFPAQIAFIRLPRNLSHLRALARSAANVYHDPVNAAEIFREMRAIQHAALKCLASSGAISVDELKNGRVLRTGLRLPDQLVSKLQEYLDRQPHVTEAVLGSLGTIPLLGVDGLKHRTSLMEHKYDLA